MKSVSMRMVTYAVLRWGSQSVVVRTPSFIDVIKSVCDPLLLEHSVPLLTDVERLASPATQTRQSVTSYNPTRPSYALLL